MRHFADEFGFVLELVLPLRHAVMLVCSFPIECGDGAGFRDALDVLAGRGIP